MSDNWRAEHKTTFYLDDIFRVDQEKDAGIGVETHLGDILERSAFAMKLAKKLKKLDPDGYSFFSRVGVPMTTSESCVWGSFKLPKLFLEKRPGICGLLVSHPRDGQCEELLQVRAVFMLKVKSPVNVQPSNHDIYRVTVLYGEELLGGTFHVSIDDDGAVRALKEMRVTHQKTVYRVFAGKKSAVAGSGREARFSGKWEYPFPICDDAWSEEPETHYMRNVTPDQRATFYAGYGAMFMPDPKAIRVKIRRGDYSLTWRIHRRACARFFRDRDLKDRAGRRIFHYQRGHFRALASGGETLVRPSYPGLSRFDWRGYEVTMSMPKHKPATKPGGWSLDLSDVDISSRDARDMTVAGETLSPDQLADRIAPFLEPRA